jgi:formylglycine-generating enzyme required for sulfatase activity
MSPIDAQRIQTVFLTASAIDDPAEQARYLDGACGGDAGLRSRVDALLRAGAQPDSLLDQPLVAPFDPAGRAAGPAGEADDEIPLGFLAPSPRPDALGRIGHFDVLQVLGRGGFGIVFRAFDSALERVVAVKVLAPQLAVTSPARKRFLREARSAAAVRHENVVQVYEIGEQPLPYIAMEFVPGETLQQRLDATGPIDAADVVRVGRQVAEGLAAAHATGLIHRDVKPANLLLERGGLRVKITDFGLARAADDASRTHSGVIAGTPMYMAPEQALGRPLDPRADLFSLGSVLYVMAAGRPPFRASGALAVLKRVAEDAPRPIREVIPEVPEWLCAIIAKLHAKDPADRYQTARELADVLADCEAQVAAHGRLRDFSRIPRGTRPAARTFGRWKWAAAVLPVVALAAAAVPGVVDRSRGEPGAPAPAPEPAAAVAPPAAVAPFDAAQARQHQQAWADYLGVPVVHTNSLGMAFRLIPPGEFTMGATDAEARARFEYPNSDDVERATPAHRVRLTRPFYLGEREVSYREFLDLMMREPGGQPKSEHNRADDVVMSQCTWYDCVEFCNRLSERDGLAPAYRVSGRAVDVAPGATGYRLPTEAEWEFACRAGTTTLWYFGLTAEAAQARCRKDLREPMHYLSSESAKANPFGLACLYGSSLEWCWDRFDPGYYRACAARGVAVDPQGPDAGGPTSPRAAAQGLRTANS